MSENHYTPDRLMSQMIAEMNYYREHVYSGAQLEMHMTWDLYQMLVAHAMAEVSYNKPPETVAAAPIRIVADSGLKYWISFAGMIKEEEGHG